MTIVIDSKTGRKVELSKAGGFIRGRYQGRPNSVFGVSENDAVRKLLGTSDRPSAPLPRPIGPEAWGDYIKAEVRPGDPAPRKKVEAAPVGAISKNGKFQKASDGSWVRISAAAAGK